MKTKEEIKKGLNEMSIHSEAQKQCIKDTIDYIESLNPYKIDEERIIEIFDRYLPTCHRNYNELSFRQCIQKYNSTIPEIKQLEPLPSEMPKYFDLFKLNNSSKNVWEWFVSKYGTPKREWWMDCEKFVFEGNTYKSVGYSILKNGEVHLYNGGDYFNVKNCTPYIEPNTREKLLAKLDDEGKELLKQLEAERC